ncbi:hypothetical protein GQ457_18G009850 [Hibiscus cannabinus]
MFVLAIYTTLDPKNPKLAAQVLFSSLLCTDFSHYPGKGVLRFLGYSRRSFRIFLLSTYQKEGRKRVKVKDLKPKRIKGYLEYKFSQRSPALLKYLLFNDF